MSEIISLVMWLGVMAWTIFNYISLRRLRKRSFELLAAAESGHQKSLKEMAEATQILRDIKKRHSDYLQQNNTEDRMSRTHKTNITTSCPNLPVISQAKPSKQVTHTRSTQSRPVSSHPIYQTHHNDLNPFDVVRDSQDIMRNFSSDSSSYSDPHPPSSYDPGPSASYDSGSSYDSFGGGSSDGGGASSGW